MRLRNQRKKWKIESPIWGSSSKILLGIGDRSERSNEFGLENPLRGDLKGFLKESERRRYVCDVRLSDYFLHFNKLRNLFVRFPMPRQEHGEVPYKIRLFIYKRYKWQFHKGTVHIFLTCYKADKKICDMLLL